MPKKRVIKKPVGFKARVKTELGYMKAGAKVLPKAVGEKVKASARAWWEEKKEEGRQMRQAEQEAKLAEKEAEREAYKVEMVAQARQRGVAKAKKRAAGGGSGGWLKQLGEAGQRLSVADSIGLDTKGAVAAGESAFGYQFQGLEKPVRRQRQNGGQNGGSPVSSYIFEGLGFGQPQQPAKKKRRS